MSEKSAIFVNDFVKNIIDVYFDTFFVFYFFQVAEYQVVPLAKYYLTLYITIGVVFFLLRNAMKKNIKVPYFRIGVSLQALYISMIMLFKDKMVDLVFLVAIVKGVAEAFYHYPKNLLDSEKISNTSRQRFSGVLNLVNQVVGIIIPLILGILLSIYSYTDIGKVIFVLFIALFINSFFLKDEKHIKKKSQIKDFIKLIKKDKDIRNALLIPFLSGLTYSSGVMEIVVTLFEINHFKTNLVLGYAESISAGICLLTVILFTVIIKKSSFKRISYISGILSFLALLLFALFSNITTLIIYLIVRNSLVVLINLFSNNISSNLSNCKELKEEFKTEYFLARDLVYSLARSIGYLVLLIVCLTVGMDYIDYILILSSIALLLESIITGKLSSNY